MNMREQIAKAIYEQRNGAGAVPWSRRDFRHKQPYLYDADAALNALMEPTEGMLRAGDKVLCEEIVCNCDEREIFRVMIHAAKEGR